VSRASYAVHHEQHVPKHRELTEDDKERLAQISRLVTIPIMTEQNNLNKSPNT
jgi:hypothetical protein